MNSLGFYGLQLPNSVGFHPERSACINNFTFLKGTIRQEPTGTENGIKKVFL
jgi:hypothetical protein